MMTAGETETASLTWFQMLHHNLAAFDDAVVRFLPRLAAIAGDPRLDALVEAALTAAGAGVGEELFAAAADMLHAAARHRGAAQPPPQPQAAPPAPPAAAAPAQAPQQPKVM